MVNQLLAALNTLLPIIIMVGVGAFLRHKRFHTEAFFKELNRLIFWVALPCLLVSKIMRCEFDPSWGRMILVLMLTTLLIAGIAWFGSPLFGVGKRSRGSFTQSVFRSNNAYVGIPVIQLAVMHLPNADALSSKAMLTLAPCLILYNVLAVIVLMPDSIAASEQGDTNQLSFGMQLKKIAFGVMRNPLIIGCVIGVVLMLFKVRFPTSIDKTIEHIGNLSTPGALLALGGSLTLERLRSSIKLSHVAACLKLVVCPLIGLGLSCVFGLSAEARFIALIFLACPSAVASYVMAVEMKGDAILAGSTVALTTLYSLIAIGAVVFFAGI